MFHSPSVAEESLRKTGPGGLGTMRREERGIPAPGRDALGHQPRRAPGRNGTPEKGHWAEELNHHR